MYVGLMAKIPWKKGEKKKRLKFLQHSRRNLSTCSIFAQASSYTCTPIDTHRGIHPHIHTHTHTHTHVHTYIHHAVTHTSLRLHSSSSDIPDHADSPHTPVINGFILGGPFLNFSKYPSCQCCTITSAAGMWLAEILSTVVPHPIKLNAGVSWRAGGEGALHKFL